MPKFRGYSEEDGGWIWSAQGREHPCLVTVAKALLTPSPNPPVPTPKPSWPLEADSIWMEFQHLPSSMSSLS